tara:strand:- start:2205 stop:3107 length:903 start_codon:yes stop_codon:yes gene_type:complete
MTITSNEIKNSLLFNNEISEISEIEWFKSQPVNIKANTILSQLLHQAIIAKNPNAISNAFINCIEQKVWEGMAYMASIPSKRKLISYTPIEWLRQEICVEPDTLMRNIAGVVPDPILTSNASIALIDLLAKEEPDSLVNLADNYYGYSDDYMLGWHEIFKNLQKFDRSWLKVSLILSEKINNIFEETEQTNKSYSKVNNKASDSVSRLIRTLSLLSDDPDECESKGTNLFKVQYALDRLLRGITTSVEKAKREAGLEKSKKTNCGYSITGKPKNVAGRIIRRIGVGPARRIALAILEGTK